MALPEMLDNGRMRVPDAVPMPDGHGVADLVVEIGPGDQRYEEWMHWMQHNGMLGEDAPPDGAHRGVQFQRDGLAVQYARLADRAEVSGDGASAAIYRRQYAEALRYEGQGWEEAKHPRATDGRFGAKPGEQGGGSGKAPSGEKPSHAPQPEPTSSPRKMFSSIEDSQAVRDTVSGKVKHHLFTKRLGGWQDTCLEAIMKEAGTGAPPKIVSHAEMDALKEQGWTIGWRGVGDAKNLEQFRHGENYCGSGLFGNGTYMQKEGGFLGIGGKSAEKAREHVAGYGPAVTRIAMPPNARIISISKVEAMQKEYIKDLGKRRLAQEMTAEEYDRAMDLAADAGRFAALHNYDAIYATWGGYYNVLNRGMLAVQANNIGGQINEPKNDPDV